MNVQDYIESGIIESYVMDLASESERAEFEQLCRQYPELLEARRRFEEKMEAYAADHAVPPPPEDKVKVLEAIGKLESRTAPSFTPPKIIAMENANSSAYDPSSNGSSRSSGMLRLVAAADVILLVGMAFMYYRVSQDNKSLADTNSRLKESLDTTRNTLD